jgi:hypothetical protein
LDQVRSQERFRPMNPHLDTLGADAQPVRRLFGRQLLNASQHDHGSVAGRQRGDGRSQCLPCFTLQDLLLGIEGGRGHAAVGPVQRRHGTTSGESVRGLARVRDRTAHSDGREPGCEARSTCKLRQVLERFQVSFLNEILGIRVVVDDTQGHVMKKPIVPPDQNSIQRAVSGPHAGDEIFIG